MFLTERGGWGVRRPRRSPQWGIPVLRQLPGHEATPVIFMTARAQSSEVSRYTDLGAIGVIVKPFDPMSLAASVRDTLAGADG